MTPVRPPLSPPAAEPAPLQSPPERRLPLGVAVLLLALCAALLAAGTALVLEAGLGASAPWAALCGAVLGVAAAALPMAALALKPGRPGQPAAQPATELPVAGAGAVTPRALFLEWAEREWARSRRYGTGAALLLVDIDRYQRLCESRSAAAGNAVLVDLLRHTAATLRGADVLTRYADGQMAVFLAHADATGALDVAERIRQRAERLDASADGQPLRITVSVGVAHLRPAHPNLGALIEDAQDALAAARQVGGNCVRAAPVEARLKRLPGPGRDDRRKPRQQPRP
ncbi:MAG: GGDEF domain-containing protein [Betaproteobacteria bacterium]|nr:GGDEF domain-containing protein [Betaproteobacteria bacterium]MBK7515123.1 GGDEF domain-containing protein [Betaproteobacteria bacterium]MBK9685659.1 GGDEF domain-containing protein [Betaproteobacteria bacterium]